MQSDIEKASRLLKEAREEFESGRLWVASELYRKALALLEKEEKK